MAKKNLGIRYDHAIIDSLFKLNPLEKQDYDTNYHMYLLNEDTSYLETAYDWVQEHADNLEPKVKTKFLNSQIPKAIVERWEKVKWWVSKL